MSTASEALNEGFDRDIVFFFLLVQLAAGSAGCWFGWSSVGNFGSGGGLSSRCRGRGAGLAAGQAYHKKQPISALICSKQGRCGERAGL